MRVVPKDLPRQAKAGQGPEAEPPNSSVDPSPHRQHHQVRYDLGMGQRARGLDDRDVKWEESARAGS